MGDESPVAVPPPPPVSSSSGSEATSSSGWRRPVPLWATILAVLVGIGLGASGAGGGDSNTDSAVARVSALEDDLAGRDARIADLEEDLASALAAVTETEDAGRDATETSVPTEAPAAIGPVEIVAFEGVVDTETRDFTVNDGWELHWDAPGGLGCVFYVRDAASGREETSIDSEPEPAGSSYIREGGTYYLDVKCYGADYWTASVIDVD